MCVNVQGVWVCVYCVQGSEAAYLGVDSKSNLLDPSLLIA